MKNNPSTLLAGVLKVERKVRKPFDQIVINFLDRLSQEIRKDKVLGKQEEIMAFGFWCRKQHIKKLKEQTANAGSRLGKGLVFHIAPSNVPVLFAYSFAFGLLSGNSNVVRISSKAEKELRPMCRLIDRVLMEKEFRTLREQNSIISYEKSKELTDAYSEECNLRVIWGGDETIREIRKSPIPPEAEELVFPDRTSIALLDAGYLAGCSEEELELWAHRFYNDTYGADQNACSSPRVIFWLQESKDKEELFRIKQRWWKKVHDAAEKYDLTDQKAFLKYTQMCGYAMSEDAPDNIIWEDNLLYVGKLGKLPEKVEDYRGSCGFFFEFELTKLSQLALVLDRKVQTLTYLGVKAERLKDLVIANRVQGVDRIVPVGQALDIGIVWDGKNLISRMSREICLN
ncbi:acyl-CoA reductase [Anaerostipes sp.]|uniref:acyl-CoA reductase n=1 Tax=Anaerostipes sp. TaxID=1872530 RepID=UPI0025BACF2B|nr:acyl-CoA reductase [Anaerostipes sp.]MBS7009885.1 hypothetical protein [Anaerostipes sp.]